MHQNSRVVRIPHMGHNFEKLFQGLEQPELPERLERNILAHIETAKRRGARVRLSFLACVALFSMVTLIPALQYMARELSQSNFYQYISLLLSDSGTAIVYWKEFTLLLAESLPLFGITLVLSAIFVLLSSLKLAANNVKDAFMSVHRFIS